MKSPNKVLSFIKTNSSRICFTFYCQYWLTLYTYTVDENYHDAFPSFFSHVTILIKHKLNESFRKNDSVTFEEIRNKIHSLSQAQNATSLFLFVFIWSSLHAPKNRWNKWRQSIAKKSKIESFLKENVLNILKILVAKIFVKIFILCLRGNWAVLE